MRKKLLALLMCATMVLGSSAVAFAAPTKDDYDNAKKIIEQFRADKGNVTGEYDAKRENVTFTTELDVKNTSNVALAKIQYTYAFTNMNDENEYVKVNSDGNMLVRTDGNGYDATALDTTNHELTTANPSVVTAAILDNSVVKLADQLYYATKTDYEIGQTVSAGYGVNEAVAYDTPLTAATSVVTLQAFDGDVTGTVIFNNSSRTNPVSFVDGYGIDDAGYINLATSKPTLRLSKNVVDGYWTHIQQASDSCKNEIANALSEGTISSKAVAVTMHMFKTTGNDSKRYDNGVTAGITRIESGFEKLVHVNADVASHDVTFKTDWLSQSNAKDANVVYLLDSDVVSFTNNFQRVGSIYKVSDLSDNKFSTQYVVSGTYIFDVATDASNNDGVSDTTTADTTTAASTTTSSPKTGDVAPIAALAVVMMGACGAMVVASKKRA